MKTSIGALSVIALSAALTGCSSSSPSYGPTPGPSGPCNSPANNMEVLYPIPGSKNAPPTLSNIYVSTSPALPPSNSFNFVLMTSNPALPPSFGTSVFFGISASQIPTPHKTPSYPNPIYYATSIFGPSAPPSASLGLDTTVVAYWNDSGTNCTPNVKVTSFTTQKS